MRRTVRGDGGDLLTRSSVDLDLVPVPLIEIDISGTVLDCNAAATELLGWMPEQITGRRTVEVFGREIIGANLPHGRQRVRLTHVNGLTVEADIMMNAQVSGGDSLRSVVAVIKDTAATAAAVGGIAPRVEAWATVAQQIQEMSGDVMCVGVGLVGVEAINKGYSRSTGDAVLAEILVRLRQVAGPNGRVARVGGNQFVLAVPAASGADLHVARMMQGLSAPVTCPLGVVRVAVACGVATGPAQSALVLLDGASHATEEALAAGVGTVKIATSDNRGAALAHPRLRSCLIDDVAQDRIDVVYQPIVDVETGEIVQLEALARWCSSEFGVVEPGIFLDAADQIGLIHDLGDRVLARALDMVCFEHQAGRWGQRRMSMNLSARQIEHPDVVERISSALAQRGLSPEVLQIEVTETRLLTNPKVASTHLTALQRMGVGIALDEFGSGATTLSYLRDFPATVIKIGRRFTSGVLTNSTDREIIRGIAELARHLQLTVVATGVETAEQQRELARLGCRCAQGYLYSPPRADDVLAPISLPEAAVATPDDARLERLHATRLLDTPPDPRFDLIAAEAAAICSSPMAAVTLYDGRRQWLKAKVGTTQAEIPMERSLCIRTLQTGLPTEVADPTTILGERGIGSPIKFHVSVPLRVRSGHVLGTLCVANDAPRQLDAAQRQALQRLADRAATRLDLAIAEHDLAVARADLDRSRDTAADLARRSGAVLDRALDGLMVLDTHGRVTLANARASALLGSPTVVGAFAADLVDEGDRMRAALLLEQGQRTAAHASVRIATTQRLVDMSVQPSPGRDGAVDVMVTLRPTATN